VNTDIQLPNFSAKGVKLCCGCPCVSEFIIPRHISETGSLHYRKETTSKNVSAVHFITIFCFTSGIYELFLGGEIDFY
jgi:hypothetical protein